MLGKPPEDNGLSAASYRPPRRVHQRGQKQAKHWAEGLHEPPSQRGSK